MNSAVLSRDHIVDALEHMAQFGVPLRGAAHLFDVGTSGYLDHFQNEVIDGLVVQGGATCKVFEGPYGSGKTHLLTLLEEAALRRGMAVVRTDLSEALSLEDWQNVARHILQNVELGTPSGIVRSLPRVLEAIAREREIDRTLLSNGLFPHAGFARAMALMCGTTGLSANARELLSRFLQGERVTIAALKAHGVPGVKHPLSKRNAELVIKSVLVGLHRLGVPGTLLLFDETEKTFAFNRHSPPKKVVVGANLLRRLIDATANGSLIATAVVFAVLPGFIESCALAYPALGQRLHRGRGTTRVSWRWPVLPVDRVTQEIDPKRFLGELVERFASAVAQTGAPVNGLRETILREGAAALREHAGSDYRRYVVKRIATASIQHSHLGES